MMNYILILLFFLLFELGSLTNERSDNTDYNYISNPTLEMDKEFEGKWFNPDTEGNRTPNFIQRSKQTGLHETLFGKANNDSSGSIGLICYNSNRGSKRGYSEFVSNELSEPLIPGKAYQFKLDYTLGHEQGIKGFSEYALKGMGIYLTKEIPNMDNIKLEDASIALFDNYWDEHLSWDEETIEFVAEKDYKYITIGFFSDIDSLKSDRYVKFDAKKIQLPTYLQARTGWTYYFMDNFSLREISVDDINLPDIIHFPNTVLLLDEKDQGILVNEEYGNKVKVDTLSKIYTSSLVRNPTTTKLEKDITGSVVIEDKPNSTKKVDEIPLIENRDEQSEEIIVKNKVLNAPKAEQVNLPANEEDIDKLRLDLLKSDYKIYFETDLVSTFSNEKKGNAEILKMVNTYTQHKDRVLGVVVRGYSENQIDCSSTNLGTQGTLDALANGRAKHIADLLVSNYQIPKDIIQIKTNIPSPKENEAIQRRVEISFLLSKESLENSVSLKSGDWISFPNELRAKLGAEQRIIQGGEIVRFVDYLAKDSNQIMIRVKKIISDNSSEIVHVDLGNNNYPIVTFRRLLKGDEIQIRQGIQIYADRDCTQKIRGTISWEKIQIINVLEANKHSKNNSLYDTSSMEYHLMEIRFTHRCPNTQGYIRGVRPEDFLQD